MEMLAAAADDGRWDPQRPIFSVVYCPISPLQHEREMLDASIELARLGVPMCVYTLATCGATAPLTMAGGVTQTNAEILSSLVVFQLARRGAPVIYTTDCGILDMRSGTYASCGPEAILMNAALAEMARHYELPSAATGLTSDAREYSVVAGFEGGAAAMVSMLMRPDVLIGAGLIDSAQMLVEPKLLLDAEFFRQCRAVAAGFSIDDEHLSTDLIKAVVPGGHYLAAKESAGSCAPARSTSRGPTSASATTSGRRSAAATSRRFPIRWPSCWRRTKSSRCPPAPTSVSPTSWRVPPASWGRDSLRAAADAASLEAHQRRELVQVLDVLVARGRVALADLGR